MLRDNEAFRQRYKAYKEGRPVSEIYDAGLPRYAGGSQPYDGYEQFVDDIIKEEGFLKHVTDIGDGKQTLGSGLTNPKWHELYRKRGNVWTEQDNRNAVKYELGQIANYLRKIFPDYDKYPTGIQEVLQDIQYNTGKVNMKYSPKFVTAVKKGDWFEAARQMDWGNSDPVFGKGLRNRNRRRQQKLYQSLNLKEQPIVEQPDAIKPYPGAIPQEEVTTVYDPQLNRRFDPRPRLQIPTQITLPSLEQTMEETTWKPPVQLYSDGKEPKITKGRGFSRLENFERRLQTTGDDDTLHRVAKHVGRGAVKMVKDLKRISGLDALYRVTGGFGNVGDYIDLAASVAGGAIVNKLIKSSKIASPILTNLSSADVTQLGKFFFKKHPELMSQPKEAWYKEIANVSNDYFNQALSRRAKQFAKEGKFANINNAKPFLKPKIKTAAISGSKYGGIYSPQENTMLINTELVTNPRLAMTVYNHERQHALQKFFTKEVGRPYPVSHSVMMEQHFPFTQQYKLANPNIPFGLETDATLNEAKSLMSYDSGKIGTDLDNWILSMSPKQFSSYLTNGYANNMKPLFPKGLKDQKYAFTTFKCGKQPR